MPDILLVIMMVWNDEPGRRDCIMLWAAVCLLFFWFLESRRDHCSLRQLL